MYTLLNKNHSKRNSKRNLMENNSVYRNECIYVQCAHTKTQFSFSFFIQTFRVHVGFNSFKNTQTYLHNIISSYHVAHKKLTRFSFSILYYYLGKRYPHDHLTRNARNPQFNEI